MTKNRSGTYQTQLTGYKAFIPADLPPYPPIDQSERRLAEELSSATKLITKLNDKANSLPNIDLFVGSYVQKEALISAQIEGTQATLEDIFDYGSKEKTEKVNDIAEVINYIKAMNYGLKRLDTLPMSLRLLKELHEILLHGARGKDKTPGEFRTTQNWIGRPGCTLKTASFIPPPPQDAKHALSELEKYMHHDKTLPQLINAALIHYQFETIHPFLDGNGRLGRLLITFYLSWKGLLKKPLLYLSYFFKKNRQEYFDRLSMVRKTGNYEQWISFFLQGIIETATSALETSKKILELKDKYTNQLLKQDVSSKAVLLLDQLFFTPIISIRIAQEKLQISYPAASTIVHILEDAGILHETTGKKRGRRFAFQEYIDLLSEGTEL